MINEYALETKRLEKVYRARFGGREIKAVTDLSLRVPIGSKFGLLGANGAGKTTFVKMVLSAVHPTSGTASIFGKDSAKEEARRPVGYLPENHRFPTYLTGAGMLDLYGALSGVDGADRKKRIPEYLEMVGLKGWGEVRIKKYSKGMLQRLGLAQALIHKPRLLILDEPTDGVDPVGRREIRDVLNRLTGTGVTVFLNSHLLGEVESFCEYVAILKRGQLALEGKISSLVAGSGYSLVVSNLPESLVDALKQRGVTVALHEAGLELHARSREDCNQVIDSVRAAGGMIESMQATNISLEDVFIRTTQAERVA
jgi:ABC-2 type transport system ATP-binding protein